MSTKTEPFGSGTGQETKTIVFTTQHIEDLVMICKIAELMKPESPLIGRYRERFEQLQ